MPTHPRPQLTRPWTDLGGTWGFAHDDADVGRDEGWHDRADPYERDIVVPFPPEAPLSGIGDTGYHPVVWYRRTVEWQPTPGLRTVLHFGAVDYLASVWVNGHLVAEHEGGHTRFDADVTAALHADRAEQVISVRAEDHPRDLEQPRGKQDWERTSHAIWYDRTTGIWQPVWFEEVSPTRIASVHFDADVAAARLAVAVRLHRPTTPDPAGGPPLRLRLRLTLHDEVLADDTYAVAGDSVLREVDWSPYRELVGRERLLWAPEHPNVVEATLELLDGDEVLDTVGSYTALRSVDAGDGLFRLNGRPYVLRLVLEQGYWPESHLAAPSEDALRREVELALELGFNGVRLHQRTADPRYLAECDRRGLLVWAEMPSAYAFSARTAVRLTREWAEVVERDRSHPCVVAWVPFNESWGLPALPTSQPQQHLVRTLYSLTKAIDPSRPVVGNDGWEQVVTDILTVHDYTASGDVLRDRYGSLEAVDRTLYGVQPQYHAVLLTGSERGRQPVMVTEFGGITLASLAGSQAWNGYGAVRDVDAFVDRYRGLVDALLDSPAVTGFCYTQLTDTGQEQNGLLTERREPKVPVDVIRAINRRTSAAVPADAVGAFQYGDYPLPLDEPTGGDAGS